MEKSPLKQYFEVLETLELDDDVKLMLIHAGTDLQERVYNKGVELAREMWNEFKNQK